MNNFTFNFLFISQNFYNTPFFTKNNLNLNNNIFKNFFFTIIYNSNIFKIRNSYFSNILNNCIINSNLNIINQRLYNPIDTIIINTNFINIFGNLEGGAIYSDINNIKIEFCYFELIYTSQEGGVIFKKNGNLIINKCYFFLCRSSHPTNNYGGNIIRTYSCNLNIYCCNAYKCWNISTSTSDSLIRSTNGLSIINNLNSTKCYGSRNWGAVLGEFQNIINGTTFKFIQLFQGYGYRLVCNYETSNNLYIYYSNFINNSVDLLFDWYNIYVIQSNIYFNTQNVIHYSYLIDCFGDFSKNGLIITSFHIKIIPICFNKETKCFNYYYIHFNFFLLIIYTIY